MNFFRTYTVMLVMMLAAAAPVSAGTTEDREIPGIHVVRSGDTLYRIGQLHGVTWQTLAEYNALDNPHLIFPGQRVRMPGDDRDCVPISTIGFTGAYLRIFENLRIYELISIYKCCSDGLVPYLYATQLNIFNYMNGIQYAIATFDIPERRSNANGGFFIQDFADERFLFIWLGHEGNRGTINYTAFIYRNYEYIQTNFSSIPNPHIRSRNDVLGRIQSGANFTEWHLYVFDGKSFILTDVLYREGLSIYPLSLQYTISMQSGERINEIYIYPENHNQIITQFYAENSRWQLHGAEWIDLFALH